MHYLVATDSVHTTAAACDYLLGTGGVDPEDRVTALAVAPAGDRDADDALNVVRSRLAGAAAVETVRRTGDPAAEVLAAADEREADLLVVGARAGDPDAGPADGERRDAADLGSTARAVAAGAEVPVAVVPYGGQGGGA